jgi:ribosome-associated translation inhibitor RaiA
VEIRYSDRDHTGDGRIRAYAHYRVFEAFRCVASQIRTVDVSMGRDRRAGHPHRVTCTVRAELRDGEHIVVAATADWPYAAIQQAATRARRQLDGELTTCAK